MNANKFILVGTVSKALPTRLQRTVADFLLVVTQNTFATKFTSLLKSHGGWHLKGPHRLIESLLEGRALLE